MIHAADIPLNGPALPALIFAGIAILVLIIAKKGDDR